MTRQIGVRALRQGLAAVLAEVEAGEIVEVTRDGKPIARIAPMIEFPPDTPPGVRRMVLEGRMQLRGPIDLTPPSQSLISEGPTLAEILLEQRGPKTP